MRVWLAFLDKHFQIQPQFPIHVASSQQESGLKFIENHCDRLRNLFASVDWQNYKEAEHFRVCAVPVLFPS